MITISKNFNFEASHVLPEHPGQCSRLHGHSWELEVAVTGKVDPKTGFVMDYGDLKNIVHRSIISRVDHQHLGYGSLESFGSRLKQYIVPMFLGDDFYPSSENLVEVFAAVLREQFDCLPREAGRPQLKLAWVKLKETCTSEAIWTPE